MPAVKAEELTTRATRLRGQQPILLFFRKGSELSANTFPDSVNYGSLGKSSMEDEMFTSRGNFRRNAVCFLYILLCFNLLSRFALGQEHSAPQKLAYGIDRANVPDAIQKVRSGEFVGVHVDLIARAGAVEAIPALKQQFAHVEDPLLKAKIAGALVRLGDKDDTYWDFLVKQASAALDSEAPDFTSYDRTGKAASRPSPEFEAWLKKSSTSPEAAAEDSLYLLPGRVLMLGWSRDRRAIPYLRRGLSSPNYMIEIAAAEGLAEIGDENSIALIVGACQKAPAEVAQTIANLSLVYFDDKAAQSAVDQYVRKDLAKASREARASGLRATPLSPPLYDKPPSQ